MNNEAEGCKDGTWEWARADTALDGREPPNVGALKQRSGAWGAMPGGCLAE